MIRCRRPLTLTSAVAAGAAAALLTAGCGKSPSSPGIASVSSSPATATAATPHAGPQQAGKPPSGGGQSHFQMSMKIANATLGTKFSACMRQHGVQNFPDPNGQGAITFGSGMGIDPDSPVFHSAETTCHKLLPNGGQPTAQQLEQQQQKLLAVSKCMRAHGIKDFPDPSNGGLRIRATPGSDLDPDNPQLQTAQNACQGDLPLPGSVHGTAPAGK